MQKIFAYLQKIGEWRYLGNISLIMESFETCITCGSIFRTIWYLFPFWGSHVLFFLHASWYVTNNNLLERRILRIKPTLKQFKLLNKLNNPLMLLHFINITVLCKSILLWDYFQSNFFKSLSNELDHNSKKN